MTIISDSLQAVQANILLAKIKSSLQDTVFLVAVSKAQTADRVKEAYHAGQAAFGENYLQEAIIKQNLLTDCNIEWHFIGPIQSNKTQLIAQHFSWVQSVDRLKIAQRLSNARGDTLPPLNVCIQLNSSNEASKSGIQTQELIALAKAITDLPNLTLRGVMAIPAPTHDVAKQREQFQLVKAAFLALQEHGFAVDTLSIGMSDDYMVAIEEGATMVRVGSAIFGARTSVKNNEE
jgi:pyridoxal phosphate enzyme (YggS family)